MHDKLYANFRQISQQNIYKWAQEIGLDLVRFTADLNSGKYKKAVERDVVEGEQAGVAGTPTIFVNGKRFNGSLETDEFERVLAQEMSPPAKLSRR